METTLNPQPLVASPHGVNPGLLEQRAYKLGNMTSVLIESLFPELPPSICIKQMQQMTIEKLAMLTLESRIENGQAIQIIAHKEGFTALDRAYTHFIGCILHYLEQSARCSSIALCVDPGNGAYLCKVPSFEAEYHGAIEVIEKPKKGIKTIYAGCSDPYHMPSQSAIQDFLKDWKGDHSLGGVYLLAGPQGIYGVEGDMDLGTLCARTILQTEKNESPWRSLLDAIPQCIVIADMSQPLPDAICAGISLNRYARGGDNSKIRGLIHHYACLGLPCVGFSKNIPTFVVNWEQADFWDKDPDYMDYALTNKTLEGCLNAARSMTGINNILIFDGVEGGCNVSKELAQFLEESTKRY